MFTAELTSEGVPEAVEYRVHIGLVCFSYYTNNIIEKDVTSK